MRHEMTGDELMKWRMGLSLSKTFVAKYTGFSVAAICRLEKFGKNQVECDGGVMKSVCGCLDAFENTLRYRQNHENLINDYVAICRDSGGSDESQFWVRIATASVISSVLRAGCADWMLKVANAETRLEAAVQLLQEYH